MGQEWTVRTDNDGVKIPKGTLVEVINVSGVKLIVKKNKGGLENGGTYSTRHTYDYYNSDNRKLF